VLRVPVFRLTLLGALRRGQAHALHTENTNIHASNRLRRATHVSVAVALCASLEVAHLLCFDTTKVARVHRRRALIRQFWRRGHLDAYGRLDAAFRVRRRFDGNRDGMLRLFTILSLLA
jgi:hypothetical protein